MILAKILAVFKIIEGACLFQCPMSVVVRAMLFFLLDCLDEKRGIKNWNINECSVGFIRLR